MNLQGDRTFAASRDTVWEVLNDPAAMARTMPGVESFDVHDDRRWTANVKIPLGLGGLRMKIDMQKVEERAPEFAALDIKGTGVGALVRMKTSFELADGAEGGTAMHWAADVRIAGPVGSMGQRVLQPIVNQQVQHVLGALDREVQSRVSGTTREGEGEKKAASASPPGEASPSLSGTAGHDVAPSPEAPSPPAEGPTDYGEPAESTRKPEPPAGTSGADEGVSPWSPEGYEPEPDGPTTSTEDS